MTTQEKVLYHQIHPLKLATDIGAQLASGVCFWSHHLVVGLIVMFLPAIVVSLVMLNTMDFSRIKESAIGRYLKGSMTHAMEAVRFAGDLPMSLGFWYHLPWMIVLGFAVVLAAWLRGLVWTSKSIERDAKSI